MICPKIRRALVGPTGNEQSEEVVAGICDYIPHSVKCLAHLNIALVGNHTHIVNQILWNQFFAKSLAKQAYYSLVQHYATEGRQTMTAVFAKYQGKVYKMDQVVDWKSALREAMLKQEQQVASLELQGFSNKGNIRKIAIFISKYPVTIDKLHLIITTESIQVAKVSKNEFVSQSATEEFRLLEETDRTNKYRDNASINSHTHKTKYSQASSISMKTKQSQQSKENTNNYSSKTPSRVSSKKGLKKKKSQQKSFKKDMPPLKSQTDPKSTLISLTPQRNTVNRESVLAKIITSKEQQIIFLKEQLQDKNYEYEITIREQEQTHKKEIQKITKSVKEVLDSYSHSQKQAMNESLYLKQRVKILEETIEKTNGKLQTYTQQVQGYVTHVRQLQDINSRLSNTNKKLAQEQDRHHSSQLAQMTRLNAELLQWKQKAQDYRLKYEKIVDMMKNVISLT